MLREQKSHYVYIKHIQALVVRMVVMVAMVTVRLAWLVGMATAVVMAVAATAVLMEKKTLT